MGFGCVAGKVLYLDLKFSSIHVMGFLDFAEHYSVNPSFTDEQRMSLQLYMFRLFCSIIKLVILHKS